MVEIGEVVDDELPPSEERLLDAKEIEAIREVFGSNIKQCARRLPQTAEQGMPVPMWHRRILQMQAANAKRHKNTACRNDGV